MSKTLVIAQKKEMARALYLQGETIAKVLASKVGVNEKTMGNWIKNEGWENLRKNIPLVKQQQLQNLLSELEQLNEFIKTKPEGKRFADAKEGDVRRKLIKDIEALENEASIADVVSVSIAMTKFIAQSDLKKAQELSMYFDAYIKDKLK